MMMLMISMWLDFWAAWFRIPAPRKLVYMEFHEGEIIYAKAVPHRCSA